MKHPVLPAVAALSMHILTAAAQDTRIPEVVVSAARVEQELADVIPSTSVITRERIEASQAMDIATILRREAGVEITQTGGVGNQSSVFLRGSNSTHALVLIDGVRVQSLTTGTTSIEHLMPAQIERIEIVRGNVSSLYGSQAMGGLIQIFTRKGSGPAKVYADVQVGSRDTRSAATGVSGSVGATSYALNVSSLITGGFSSINPQVTPAAAKAVNPDRDGYRNQSVSASLSHRIDQAHEVGGRFFRTEGYANYDNAFGKPADTHYSAYFGEGLSAFWRAQWMPRWRSTLTYARGKDYLKTHTNGIAAAPVSSVDHQWTWQNQVRLADGHRLDLTYESQRIGIDTTTNYARKTRGIESMVAGYAGSVSIVEAQVNFRSDRFSDFGTKQTYFAGASAALTPEWRIIASGSTAFKAPTFNEMFFPGGANPTLRPEQARTSEAALQWAGGTHIARLTYFDTRYVDLITGFPAQNVARSRVNGAELTWSGRLAGFDVRANATMQEPRNEVDGTQLLRRARRFGSIGIARDFGAWNVALDWRGSNERRDTDIIAGTSLQLPAYRIFDMTARYSIDKRWSLGARLENATDQNYSLVHGYNTPRRGMFMTLSYRS
jgi:vitamin B12 transporter